MRTQTITVAQLRELLGAITHATPLGLIALTDARLRRTSCPFVYGRKLVKLNVMTGADYEASVQRKGNETFTARDRQWGTRVGPSLAHHVDRNGQEHWYLVGHVNSLMRPRPLYLVPQPRPKGGTILTAVPKAKLAQWLPADRMDEEAARQGLPDGTKPVVYRNWRLDSIMSLTLNGVRYRVRQPSLSS